MASRKSQSVGYWSMGHCTTSKSQITGVGGADGKVPETCIFTTTAWDLTEWCDLSVYRLCAESARRSVEGWRGIASQGADFWRFPNGKGTYADGSRRGRYVNQGWVDGLSPAILGAGKVGPVTTRRFQMMREAYQEAEVNAFVEGVLRDENKKARLSPELMKRIEQVLGERAEMFRYYALYLTNFYYSGNHAAFFEESVFLRNSEQLYDIAGDVAKALEK